MLRLYEKYLEAVDDFLVKCFESQKPLIKCKPGCSICCEAGEYPFSRLEMEYLMEGFLALSISEQQQVKKNIKKPALTVASCINVRFCLQIDSVCYMKGEELYAVCTGLRILRMSMVKNW